MQDDDQMKCGKGDGDGSVKPRKIDDVSFSGYKYEDTVTTNRTDLVLVNDDGDTIATIPPIRPPAEEEVDYAAVSGVYVVIKDRLGNVIHRELKKTSKRGRYFLNFHVLVDRNVDADGDEKSP